MHNYHFLFFLMWVYLQRFASHWTTSSSAEWSLDKPPSCFVRGHELTVWDIVWVLAAGAQVRVCLMPSLSTGATVAAGIAETNQQTSLTCYSFVFVWLTGLKRIVWTHLMSAGQAVVSLSLETLPSRAFTISALVMWSAASSVRFSWDPGSRETCLSMSIGSIRRLARFSCSRMSETYHCQMHRNFFRVRRILFRWNGEMWVSNNTFWNLLPLVLLGYVALG